MKTTTNRTIREIAFEINQEWPHVNFAARPYLDAMLSLEKITDSYGLDSGRSIVLYFLSNAGSFRGPEAKRIKAELKAILAA